MSGWHVLSVAPGRCAQAQLAALASAPRSPSSLLPSPHPHPRFPAPGKQRAPRRPSSRPPAAGLSGGAAELPRTPGPQVAHGLRAGHARPSGRLLDCPGPEEEAVGGMEEREVGPTSMPGSNPDGKQRWRPHPGSRTRVALAQPVWTLQWGGSKLLTEGAGQLSGEWSAAEGVGRRG